MPPKSRIWRPGDVVVGMARQARIVHVRHLCLLGQPRRKHAGVRAVALHADGQGFDARARPATNRTGQERRRRHSGKRRSARASSRRPATAPPMTSEWPRQILGRAVNHQVGPELDRPLQIGGGEGIIHGQQATAVVRQRGDRGDIDDLEQRVGRRFDPDELGGRAQDRGESFGARRLRCSAGRVPTA